MKAIRINNYGQPNNLELVEIPIPKISDNEILIRVKAAGVNHIDNLKASGLISHIYPLEMPWIPGADFAGEIHSIGKNVTNFKMGDVVYGSKAEGGAYAEFIVVMPDQISIKPHSLSFTEAAAVPMVAETALMGLFKYGHLESGQTVLIQGGAGGVGSCAIQLAYQAGATVFVTADEKDKEYLLSLGASKIIDYKTQKFETVTGTVDMVFDLIGGEVQERSFAVIKAGGYLVATNQPPSDELAEKFKIKAVFIHAMPSLDSLKQISGLIDAGKLKLDIAQTYPLHDAALAWNNIAMNIMRDSSLKLTKINRKHGKHVLEM